MSTVASENARYRSNTKKRGKLVQCILDLFEQKPGHAFTTADLAMVAYGTPHWWQVTRSQRVEVQRAMKRAVEVDSKLNLNRWSTGAYAQRVIYDSTDIESRMMCDLKANQWEHGYQNPTWGYDSSADERSVRNWMAKCREKDDYKPGGCSYRVTQLAIARLNGDVETITALEAEQAHEAAEAKKTLAALAARLNSPPESEAILRKVVSMLVSIEASDEDLERVVASVTALRQTQQE
jgi:hypothetical protein